MDCHDITEKQQEGEAERESEEMRDKERELISLTRGLEESRVFWGEREKVRAGGEEEEGIGGKERGGGGQSKEEQWSGTALIGYGGETEMARPAVQPYKARVAVDWQGFGRRGS